MSVSRYLTAILEGLVQFIQPDPQDVAETHSRPLSLDLIFLVVNTYDGSTKKTESHTRITSFVGQVPNIFHSDTFLEGTIKLLEDQRYDSGMERTKRAGALERRGQQSK
ncbi:hypothetical protein FRB93_005315 [Tulasnella sp. JGI-2019a]|nr:hypothetical protein FRB93_005315 [Tulasnella sp. JGI-2019a]